MLHLVYSFASFSDHKMTKMIKFNSLIVIGMAAVLSVTSCKKDDPIIPNEEEVITTLTFTLSPNGGGTPVILTFQDLDGDGGNAPIITEGVLDANTSYSGALALWNEVASPAENITTEVAEEALDHQFFFQSSVSGLSIDYNDTDSDGNPIGLATVVTTTGTGSGNITLTLRHEPNKNAAGVSNGDMDSAGGETDIEVTFNVDVQ